ncbi:hypothetical protein BH10PSE6_BH10PSE6_19530 [soil metagenome]
MPIQCTVSHGTRLVLAIAKDRLLASDLVGFLFDLDREKAQGYRKIFDITGVTSLLSDERIETFAQIVLEREQSDPAGPIAIVAASPVLASKATLFAEKAQGLRPIRVFAEQHDARHWLDGLPDDHVDASESP